MTRIYSIILGIAVWAVSMALSGCTDDFRFDPEGEIDGSTRSVGVCVAFEPNAESQVASRSASGQSIQDINTLRMLIYDTEGKLIYDYTAYKDNKGGHEPDVITNEAYDGKSDNRLPEEIDLQDKAAGKLTYDLKIRTGKYYIYAVANADDLTTAEIDTREKLKAVKRIWNNDPSHMSENSEMFGIFSTKPNRKASDDSPVTISNTTQNLHCWIRRLASKVTVAFDGSELFDNVQIFIENIAIRDIPRSCTLGMPNKVGEGLSGTEAEVESLLYPLGDTVFIQDVHESGKTIVPENFYHICNGAHPYLGIGADGNDPAIIDKYHAPAAKSLFFYENLQGTGKDKRQDADGDNKLDHPGLSPDDPYYKLKDDKPFGSYIEVKGWYRCVAPDQHVSEGPITYRFMLGKDETTDYNAERNTHYKLTLCFKGYGNDADWHIEYKESREIQVSTPMYISYLYNKKMMANVKITGKMEKGYRLRATIKDCSWRPWGDGSNSFPTPMKEAYTSTPTYNDGPWNSFLSLHQTNTIKLEQPGWEGAPSNKFDAKQCIDYNRQYYTDNSKGERFYEVEPQSNGYDSNAVGASGMYFVQELANDGIATTARMFSIPLFTRAKELMTKTGFTGNNPYTSYPRNSTIELCVVDASGKVVPDFEPVSINVIQVRRIINPKGVWRKSGSTEGFHVQLARIVEYGDDGFQPFKSEGKWSAEVISSGASPITLTSTPAGSGSGNASQNGVYRIEGESEHPIDFRINFNGTDGCAIVRVRYHNYTCEHDIYCREGYAPIDITGEGKQWWPSYNVDHFVNGRAEYTKSPLQEGSLFRRENYTAILASNNHKYGLGVAPGTFDVINPDGTRGTATWSGITPSVNTQAQDDGQTYSRWTITNPDEHIATGADFYTLIAKNANDITFHINKAYGVLYGDGATETQMTTDAAYGYDRTDGADDPRGMRGVFVFNSENCRQTFFPIGFSGYGHRKSAGGWANNDPDGALRYASRSEAMASGLDLTPLFLDLYRRPGAVYWLEHLYNPMPTIANSSGNSYQDNSKSCAFDMNFFTMSFEGYGGLDAVPAADAARSHGCFIRTVRSTPPPLKY